MLCVNVAILGSRHWPAGKGAARLGRHVTARGKALVVIVVSLTVLLARAGGRFDVTAEQIHSLAPDTQRLIASFDPGRPVFIQAYLSPQIPRAYLSVRTDIITLLREFDAVGQGLIYTRVVETGKYTPEAREAQERFDIRAREVPAYQQSLGSESETYMGLAFSCGPEEFVIPYMDPGLPVEYELMRSVRVVSRAERRKVGVLQTAAGIFGGFDFQTRRQTPDWSIVAELRKQYEVVQVPAGQKDEKAAEDREQGERRYLFITVSHSAAGAAGCHGGAEIQPRTAGAWRKSCATASQTGTT
ncbi:MAG: GldG family protein [Acidobacteriota bacterium]